MPVNIIKISPASEPSQDPGASRVRVLGGVITPLNLDRTVSLLLRMAQRRDLGYVCVANVHTTTLAVRDATFRNALNGATAVVADGMPVVWRVRAAGYPQAGRVYGADLVEAACATGIREGLRHAFLGGLPGVADAMVSHLRHRFPVMQVVGIWNPGILREGQAVSPDLLEAINRATPDVLWVGLGAPKQEIWMAQHRPHLGVPVMVGVGQAFDILAGRTARAPAWMGNHGLEWLYRLAREPHRLWKRYMLYNSLFLWYLLRERMGSGVKNDPTRESPRRI